MNVLGSVRGRITLLATLLVGVTLVGASFVVVRLVESDLLTSAEEALAEALEIEQELLSDSFSPVEIGGELYGLELFEEAEEGYVIGELFQDDEAVLELVLSESGELLEVFDPETGESVTEDDLFFQTERMIFDLVATDDGFLVAADDLDELQESVSAVREALTILVPLLTLVFGALTWFMVGRALQPVHAITERVGEITSSDLDRRVPVPAGNDEIVELATVMNTMLDRVESGVDRQRQFAADASHELRSPLATLRTAAEMISLNPRGDRVPTLADDVMAEADRMERLIADLLALARSESSVVPTTPADLSDLAAAAVARVSTRAGVTVAVDTPEPTVVPGHASQLERAIRNLVENAVRHASSRVVVAVTAPGTVTVDDDGPGIPVDARSTVFDRFARLDEARARSDGGAGLGLALVKAIADRHGATVHVDESPALGGARFTFSVPDALPPTLGAS